MESQPLSWPSITVVRGDAAVARGWEFWKADSVRTPRLASSALILTGAFGAARSEAQAKISNSPASEDPTGVEISAELGPDMGSPASSTYVKEFGGGAHAFIDYRLSRVAAIGLQASYDVLQEFDPELDPTHHVLSLGGHLLVHPWGAGSNGASVWGRIGLNAPSYVIGSKSKSPGGEFPYGIDAGTWALSTAMTFGVEWGVKDLKLGPAFTFTMLIPLSEHESHTYVDGRTVSVDPASPDHTTTPRVILFLGLAGRFSAQ
jgi:hypothetical protein